ncbi:MAG: hypothetical protein ACRCZ9_02365 [Fusobacteriaceae bacterium]
MENKNNMVMNKFIELITYFHQETRYFDLKEADRNEKLLNSIKKGSGQEYKGSVSYTSSIFRFYFDRFFSDFRFIVGKNIETDNVPLIEGVAGFSTTAKEYESEANEFFSSISQTYLVPIQDLKIKNASPSTYKGNKGISLLNLNKIIEFAKLVVANPADLEPFISASNPMDHETIFALAFNDVSKYTRSVYCVKDFGKKAVEKYAGRLYLPEAFVILLADVISKSDPNNDSNKITNAIGKVESNLTKINLPMGSAMTKLMMTLDTQFSKKEDYANQKIVRVNKEKSLYYIKATKYVQKESGVSQPKTDVEIPLYQKLNNEICYVGALRISLKKSNARGLEGGNVENKIGNTDVEAVVNDIIGEQVVAIMKPHGSCTTSIVKASSVKGNKTNMVKQIKNDKKIVELMRIVVFGRKETYLKTKNAFADVEANTFYDFGRTPNQITNIESMITNALFAPVKTQINVSQFQIEKEYNKKIEEINRGIDKELLEMAKHYVIYTSASSAKLRLYKSNKVVLSDADVKAAKAKEKTDAKSKSTNKGAVPTKSVAEKEKYDLVSEIEIHDLESFHANLDILESITDAGSVSSKNKAIMNKSISNLRTNTPNRYDHGKFKINNTQVIAYNGEFAITFPTSSGPFQIALLNESFSSMKKAIDDLIKKY